MNKRQRKKATKKAELNKWIDFMEWNSKLLREGKLEEELDNSIKTMRNVGENYLKETKNE